MEEEIHNLYVMLNTNDLALPSTVDMGLYTINNNFKSSFLFYGKDNKEVLLKINEEGFWVRGVKIEQGENEAKEVYQAFLNLLGYHYETM